MQFSDTQKLESLKDHWVKAKGTVSSASGTETGHRTVLQLSSIKEMPELNPKPKWAK